MTDKTASEVVILNMAELAEKLEAGAFNTLAGITADGKMCIFHKGADADTTSVTERAESGARAMASAPGAQTLSLGEVCCDHLLYEVWTDFTGTKHCFPTGASCSRDDDAECENCIIY